MVIVAVANRPADLLNVRYLHASTVNPKFAEGSLRVGDEAIPGKSLVNFTKESRKGVLWLEAGFGFSRRNCTPDVNWKNSSFFQYFLH